MWQDKVIALVSIMFTYSLIPQLIDNFKTKTVQINWQTIGITVLGLYIMSICFMTIDSMVLARWTNFITATCWLTAGIQKFVYETGSVRKI